MPVIIPRVFGLPHNQLINVSSYLSISSRTSFSLYISAMSMLPPKSPSVKRFTQNTEKRPTSPSPSSLLMNLNTPSLAAPKQPKVVLGVCAMDVKARSKAMREILTRLVDIEKGGLEVKIFGDVVILEEGMLFAALTP